MQFVSVRVRMNWVRVKLVQIAIVCVQFVSVRVKGATFCDNSVPFRINSSWFVPIRVRTTRARVHLVRVTVNFGPAHNEPCQIL